MTAPFSPEVQSRADEIEARAGIYAVKEARLLIYAAALVIMRRLDAETAMRTAIDLQDDCFELVPEQIMFMPGEGE